MAVQHRIVEVKHPVIEQGEHGLFRFIAGDESPHPLVSAQHVDRPGPHGIQGTMDIHVGTQPDAIFNSLLSLARVNGANQPEGALVPDVPEGGFRTAQVFREIPERHQGQGIGTAFLQHAEQFARAKGLQFIWAQTTPDNHGAIGSYLHAGWQFLGEIPTPFFKKNKVVRIYGKRLR